MQHSDFYNAVEKIILDARDSGSKVIESTDILAQLPPEISGSVEVDNLPRIMDEIAYLNKLVVFQAENYRFGKHVSNITGVTIRFKD